MSLHLVIKRRNSAGELSSTSLCTCLQSKLLYFAGGATQKQSLLEQTHNNTESRSTCAIWHSFGLEGLAKEDLNISLEGVQAKKTLQENGVVNVTRIFGKKNTKKPINVEIGSGFGDWIVRQALAFPDRNPFAVELCADRVYQMFSGGTLA